jgi:outer membrane protein assembly factor BamD (BamD/ComL family)
VEPTPIEPSPTRTEKQSLPAPARSPAPSAEPTVDEEVKLINGAQAALRAGDTRHALELLAQHAARFPAGKLATLRQVTHMLALCQSGKTAQARQEAADFVADKPGSPFVERVKTICAER